ncbi:MAG: hypothetical protein ACLRNW_01340 [Neglectibacter sp.]
MTYKQIEASRELRLWVGQVIVPAVTMAVALASIPEVRNAASTKLEQLKWKLKSRARAEQALCFLFSIRDCRKAC